MWLGWEDGHGRERAAGDRSWGKVSPVSREVFDFAGKSRNCVSELREWGRQRTGGGGAVQPEQDEPRLLFKTGNEATVWFRAASGQHVHAGVSCPPCPKFKPPPLTCRHVPCKQSQGRTAVAVGHSAPEPGRNRHRRARPPPGSLGAPGEPPRTGPLRLTHACFPFPPPSGLTEPGHPSGVQLWGPRDRAGRRAL